MKRPSWPRRKSDAPSQVADALNSVLTSVNRDAVPDTELARAERAALLDRLRDETDLRKGYAKYAAVLVGAQLVLADGAFITYGFYNSWNIPAQVMIGWLSGSLVEIIGVMVIITRSLFPGAKNDKTPPPGE